METKIIDAKIEKDEYTCICSVTKETLDDFVDLLKKEIQQWKEVEVEIPIRRLICIPEIK